MARQALEKRMDNLEDRVTTLDELPEKVTALESQVVQLRGEMRGEFSAIRQEMRDEFAAVREEMKALFAESQRHARILHEDVITRIAALRAG